MSVSISGTGPTRTVSVTVNVADLAGHPTFTAKDKTQQVLNRAAAELTDAQQNFNRDDQALDDELAAVQAKVAAAKAARPAGAF